MRILILAAVAVTAVAGIAMLLLRGRSSATDSNASAADPTESFTDLREQALHGRASEFSIEPVSTVWGVLMETGFPHVTITLVALADGTASMYFSSGGGVFGGGHNPSINAAARRLVGLAGGDLAKMSRTSQFPLPASGEVKFYVLTTNGVVQAGARREDLDADDHPLSDLFLAGDDVIAGLREVSERRDR